MHSGLVDTPFGGSEEDPFDLGWRASVSRCGGGVVIDGVDFTALSLTTLSFTTLEFAFTHCELTHCALIHYT